MSIDAIAGSDVREVRGSRNEQVGSEGTVMKRGGQRGSGWGRRILVVGIVTAVLAVGASAVPVAASTGSASGSQTAQAAAIANIVRNTMEANSLRAVIVKVTKGNTVVAEQAFGPSINDVPATTAMHFRNGAVAFNYLGTLLMEFVDEHKVKLDDTIERWMPTCPTPIGHPEDAREPDLGVSRLRDRPEVRPPRSTPTRSSRGHVRRAGSTMRSTARCSSLPGRTGATRTRTS